MRLRLNVEYFCLYRFGLMLLDWACVIYVTDANLVSGYLPPIPLHFRLSRGIAVVFLFCEVDFSSVFSGFVSRWIIFI